ncbi:MAG: hypothetical protein ASARMPREDX12_002011 [Alectoria sarmentosa]|nr:MAG: hypothetical protein ASARMPREDX12_002011 [Alectoria sarmentosa]
MPPSIASLWKAPDINPVNHKAKSIPALNPLNTYGRVFLLSWWGFFVAFWSWYAFPPLMTETIKKDLRLSQKDVANSNVISLVATMLVRLAAGPLCDRYGARWTFAGILLLGAIPTALAGTASTPQGLMTIRFFVGILGGSFIPCQVWTTGFFDKNVVGTANSLAAGFGNAGGGVTYFVMPAIFNSLVQHQHLTDHVAWRVAFVVPFILITFTALVMILTCPDTPTGAWSARTKEVQRHLDMRDTFFSGIGRDRKGIAPSMKSGASPGLSNDTIKLNSARGRGHFSETQAQEDDLLAAASWELVEKPTVQGSAKAIWSLPTLALSAAYFCSFGTELCVNTILGAYYAQNFPKLGQTGSGDWAALFGLLNFVFRPAGGIISDSIYRHTRSLWGKKILIHACGTMTGVFLLVTGFLNPKSKATFVGLITGLAFFEEAGNGALFSLVPHVHPTSNGLITGVTGAAGDLGGIVFLLIYRYSGTDYARVFWIVGIITILGNWLVAWIRPIPKGQLGGR